MTPPEVPPKRARRVLDGIVGGCLGAAILTVSLVASGAIARSWWEEARVYGWSEGTATILESHASAPLRAQGIPGLSVRFRCTYAGRTYESDRVDGRSSVRDPDAFRLATLWQPGSTWPCYIDPRDPRRVVLRRQSLWWGFGILVPLCVGGALGGLFLFGAWRSLRAEADAARAPSSSTLTARRVVTRLAALLVIVTLLVVTYAIGLRPLLLFASARRWRALPCTIIASRAGAESQGIRTGYNAQIVFEYVFDGRRRASGAYELVRNSNRSHQDAARLVGRYPPGAAATCYVDPTDPDRAVLDRSWPAGTALGLLPLGLLVAFIAGLAGSARRRSG